MNSHIHLLMKTKLFKKLKEKAEKKGLTLSEYCRQKLRGNSQLDQIEEKLNDILKNRKTK